MEKFQVKTTPNQASLRGRTQTAEPLSQRLAEFMEDTPLEAILVLRSSGLWAYAGRLPLQDIQEIGQCVMQGRQPAKAEGAELVRHLTLRTTGEEYLVCLTVLLAEVQLVAVYPGDLSFVRARRLTGDLIRQLAISAWSLLPTNQVSSKGAALPETGEEIPADSDASVSSPSQIDVDAGQFVEWQLESDEEWQALDLDVPITPLFPPDSVPPPTPAIAFSTGTTTPGNGHASVEGQLVGAGETSQAADNQAMAAGRAASPGQYAFALTPRLPQGALEGELAEKLAEWMWQTCKSFGWELVSLQIQPDCLLWVNRVPPDTPPYQVLHTLRRHTSLSILLAFPDLEVENPAGDFWAPAELMMMATGGLPPAQTISDFIAHSRRSWSNDEKSKTHTSH